MSRTEFGKMWATWSDLQEHPVLFFYHSTINQDSVHLWTHQRSLWGRMSLWVQAAIFLRCTCSLRISGPGLSLPEWTTLRSERRDDNAGVWIIWSSQASLIAIKSVSYSYSLTKQMVCPKISPKRATFEIWTQIRGEQLRLKSRLSAVKEQEIRRQQTFQ